MTCDVTWYDMHPNQTKIKQINMMYSMQHFVGEKIWRERQLLITYYVLTNESCVLSYAQLRKQTVFMLFKYMYLYKDFHPTPGTLPLTRCPCQHTHHSSSFWNVQMKKMAKIPAPTFTAYTHRRGEAEGEIGRETDIEHFYTMTHFYTMFFIRHTYC